jgi:hypothetical protein
VTSLADIQGLVLAGRASVAEVTKESDGFLVKLLQTEARGFYAMANRALEGEPLESVHPVYGTGILVGVNRNGFGLFHPDASDHPLEVDVFELREAIR